MRFCLLIVVLPLLPQITLAGESQVELPKPDYARDAADPEWLAYAAQFHGHLGP
jgi:hypothetical protein